jgi:hypothetical protein
MTEKLAAVLPFVISTSTPKAARRRFHQELLAHDCPTCKAPAGQPCTMPNPVTCWPRSVGTMRYLSRRHHLTRADKAYRALRNR